jgi:hypothetical protein
LVAEEVVDIRKAIYSRKIGTVEIEGIERLKWQLFHGGL